MTGYPSKKAAAQDKLAQPEQELQNAKKLFCEALSFGLVYRVEIGRQWDIERDKKADQLVSRLYTPAAQRKPLTKEQIELGHRAPWGFNFGRFHGGRSVCGSRPPHHRREHMTKEATIALERIERFITKRLCFYGFDDDFTAIKQALAQPAQEPLGKLCVFDDPESEFGWSYDISANLSQHKRMRDLDGALIYTTPPAAQPAPVPCCGKYETCTQACTPRGKFLGAREAAHGIKENT